MPTTHKAVILNDTRIDRHFGCTLVINNLIRLLRDLGIKTIGTNSVREDWRKNSAFRQKLKIADIVVVNGEGTLHGLNKDDMEHRFQLVQIAKEAKRQNKKVVLINTVYQSNPDSYKDYLNLFDIITVRESRSKAELAKIGIIAKVVPDLTFATITPKLKPKLKTYFYTDSAIKTISTEIKENAKHAQLTPVAYLRITTKSKSKWAQTRKARIYLKELSTAKFIFCGRFHALTLCLLLRKPFIAYRSNTFKVEGMLEDIGLTNRIQHGSSSLTIDPSLLELSEPELQKINDYLIEADLKIRTLFQDIKLLLSN